MSSTLGATWLGEGRCRFLVWAPHAPKVEVRVVGPRPLTAMMEKLDRGYYEAVVEGVEPGSDYVYRLDAGEERPDPASRFQPQGGHGPSQVVDTQAFAWGDGGWSGLPLENYLIYELHVGTFTPEGTFDGVIPHLDELKELGIDRKSTRLNSSHGYISYAVFCLKKKTTPSSELANPNSPT